MNVIKRIKPIRRLFIYKTDVWHFALGFIAGFIIQYNKVMSIAISIAYLLYQHFEQEHVYESVKDIATYLFGFVLGLVMCFPA
ncbi:MAG: hypothetical protein QXN34_06860 [Archaeoglobaceae archaeon]